ncbi:MAG: corrinoid protein [Clostridia bacterium]|nr:corrinoid protein [Clostridia bacterium]
MDILCEISQKLQQGRAKDIRALVAQALDDGISAQDVLTKGLLDGMNTVGVKFKNNEIFVPEVLIAARAMNAGTEILKPYLSAQGVEPVGRVILGTVKGDMHDIGKNLVKMMLEGKGLDVIDLGVDVPAEDFVAAAKENDAGVICCSALLTTTMNEMKSVVELCKKEGIRDKVKIMVGGAPITDAFCAEIGADAYTSDAASCAEVARAYFD